MIKAVLDGKMILNKDDLHNALSSLLSLPEWYGRNLDALHDCLTSITEETEIEVLNAESFEKHLGKYYLSLVNVLKASEIENLKLKITL